MGSQVQALHVVIGDLHASLVGSWVQLRPHPQPRLRARRTDEVDDGLVADERLIFPVQTEERRGGGVAVGGASCVWSVVVVDRVEVWNAHKAFGSGAPG